MQKSMETQERRSIWAGLEISPIPSTVRIPKRFVTKCASLILDARAANGRHEYTAENLRVEMQNDDHLAHLYVAGGERGVAYWLCGSCAREALDALIAGE